MPKIRLDQYLVNNALAENLTQAHSLCLQGLVHDINKQLTKAGLMVDQARSDIKVKALKTHQYVARSALKLKAAIQTYNISIQDKICLDLGCSTGGFTEVLLEYGASKVYAVDVAYGELASKLRSNAKIVLLERTNARFLDHNLIPEMLDVLVCDVSFIGLQLALPPALKLLKNTGTLLTLIKPQFEVNKEQVPQGGIIRDHTVQQQVCNKISKWLADEQNFQVIGVMPSPILGAKGNQEYVLYAHKI